MQLALGSVLPMTLYSAIQLGIFEIIAKAGPDARLSASDIAVKLPTKNPDAPKMLDRILRLLASHQVLCCSVNGLERLYSLAPVSNYFVRNQNGVSLAPFMALLQDSVFLQNSVLEGGVAFDRVHGAHAFEYPGLDPRFNQVFNAAMYNQTNLVIGNMLETYTGFNDLKQLVDIGGGLGHTIKAITSKYPQIKGINFDLPHVIEHAPAYPGVEHVGGDMFECVPKGDAIFLKWILHDWSDDHCLKLLKNCYKATPDDGKVIVMESVLPTTTKTGAAAKAASQLDVLMMTQNPGGKERTEDEFIALAAGAGFRGIKFETFVHNFWVMEFFK
ncbi:CAFFEIC ACID 3-O-METHYLTRANSFERASE 1-LIKE [Salix koriyanagi]|uniref:caffeate O-methyltransferase n=1 Tax=Salix koriyanagi TaxID=2511006 RepID=A0A9Q0YU59_9ROSI|nr:CAFFEIC ACID 3-O-METHYLTRANSFERASE 1-LIKE [Salix koriyanagi]